MTLNPRGFCGAFSGAAGREGAWGFLCTRPATGTGIGDTLPCVQRGRHGAGPPTGRWDPYTFSVRACFPCKGATGLCYVSSLKSQVQEDPGARRGGEEFSP